MATLNVFELTQAELSKTVKESKGTKSRARRNMKESVVGRRFRSARKISADKLRLESLQFVKEAEDNDEVVDYTPEEDVVLVIDPEMEETPETAEEAEEAAEELVGDFVCKCAICGANYVCSAEDVDKNTESFEGECPVCGETGEQIIIGEITPSEEDTEEEDEDVVDSVEDEFVDDEVEDEFVGDEAEDDIDVEEEEDEDEYGESISRAKRRTALRRESNARRRLSAKNTSRTRASKVVRESKNYNLDEVTLNRMLTKFAKENYDNVRFVKITKGSCRNGRLTLEGTVVTKKGSKRSTKFVCENFRPTATIQAKFTETGTFTENAISRGPSFIVDFKTRNHTITPVSLRYSYKVKEGREKFAVTGKVMNESVSKKFR